MPGTLQTAHCRKALIRLLLVICSGMVVRPAAADEAPTFSRDVLPILSENCFGCHGPDAGTRKADLRLDTREGALAAIDLESPRDSELLARIEADDAALLMPPRKSNKRLTPEQIATLRKWVENKAPWVKHWSFERPVRPEPPRIPGKEQRHPVDAFVQARLQREGLAQQPEAPRTTLIRRLSFDLIGMPPTVDEVDAFVNDRDPAAYERVVDRLLQSPHYGERMAMWWLDAARYADTDGFQGDATRTNWPWRDWVVAAFNRNQPFDQFTIEQFAGDLLPDATAEQKLATCFHRNHMTNGEGGRDPEESRIDYVMDRINTTGTVWLGLTLGCCQCHSHKFDPISHADYYSLFSFFNSIDEDGKAGTGAKPYLAYQSPLAPRAVTETKELVDQRKSAEQQAKKEAEAPFGEWLAAKAEEVRPGFDAWRPFRPATLASIEGTALSLEADGTIQASGPNPRQDDYRLISGVSLTRVTGLRLDVFPHETNTNGGYSRGASGHFILTDIKVQVQRRGSSQIRDVAVTGAVADLEADPRKNENYGEIKHVLDDDPRNGWTTNGEEGFKPHRAVFALAEPLVLDDDEELVFEMRHRSTRGDANIGRFRVSITDQPGPAVRSVDAAPLEQLAAAVREGIEPAQLDEKLKDRLREQFLSVYEPYQEHRRSLDRAAAQLAEIEKNAGTVQVMVLAEREKPRETHILVRGVWDKKGDVVERAVPQAISNWPEGAGKTRLGLAQWIVSRENPLTARVLVNHLWQMCFGAGLVRTPDDFGLQGERPTHPELLDWLAVELMEHGWNIQHVLRLIVTSETYRQSSNSTDAMRSRDPDNKLLARGARFRLPSWMLRDAALRISGEFNPALGGPPVRPYQPEGVWEEMFMGRFRYDPSEGAAQYRRTLYAFWRRAVGPTFLFDSAQRRVCEVRSSRTNTPLHALTLLNDRNFLEASRRLADRVATQDGPVASRLERLFQSILARRPGAQEQAILAREWERAVAKYRAAPELARRLLKVGQAAAESTHDVAELAGYMVVASLVFNLDEALNHE